MKITILSEHGHAEAMLGLSLSYNQPVENAPAIAAKLKCRDNGENKFLESIAVWLDITAPRYWWQQFDTYRVGITKQSQSTMHTIMKRELTEDDFEPPIYPLTMANLNILIVQGDFERVKHELPECFLQRRIICTNYKALRHIIQQRRNHRLLEWHTFCDSVVAQVEHPEFL